MSTKTLLMLASVLGALAVIVGAMGAHALPGRLEAQGLDEVTVARRVETLETGVRYHMYHALLLLAIGLWQRQTGHSANGPVALLLIGILLFSGCLYVYSVSGLRTFAMIVPLGGVSLIAGWIGLAITFAKQA